MYGRRETSLSTHITVETMPHYQVINTNPHYVLNRFRSNSIFKLSWNFFLWFLDLFFKYSILKKSNEDHIIEYENQREI